MSFSRVDKFIRENKNSVTLADARSTREVPINIVMGRDNTGKVALMTLTAVALSLRCLNGPIRVYTDEYPKDNWGMFLDSLNSEIYGSENIARVEFHNGFPIEGPVLGIGRGITEGVIADAAGWVAAINQVLPSGIPAVAPAAIFATCAAFAKVFKCHVLGHPSAYNERWTFSLFDFTQNAYVSRDFEVPALNLGSIALLGAGAIGSGFAYTLRSSGWSAIIDVIDNDKYKEPNYETTMMISKKNQRELKDKANVLSYLLVKDQTILANPIVTYITASSKELKKRRDIFICAVDNAETRRELDHANVDILLNSGVGGTRQDSGHVLCSRHLRQDLPLSSLYTSSSSTNLSTQHENFAPKDIIDDCSRIAYNNVAMAAPFIGLAAGALLVASCAHWSLKKDIGANYFKVDLLNLQNRYIRQLKPRTILDS